MSIGKILKTNIQELRKRQGLKQTDLAAIIGCSNSTIRDIEAMKARPSLIMLENIADALGVSIQDLVSSVPELPEPNISGVFQMLADNPELIELMAKLPKDSDVFEFIKGYISEALLDLEPESVKSQNRA